MNLSENFLTDYYQRHNRRRQEHLASLGLDIANKTVLEVGSGIGDHTSFFVDRGCKVTSTDGRAELLNILQERLPNVTTLLWDVEFPPSELITEHQIVYAYGILYHTSKPEFVLRNLASLCSEMLLLETCVSFGNEELINLTHENIDDPTQALEGIGCRPTRSWVFNTLKIYFPFVYLTRTQPWHKEFPVDWTSESKTNHEGLIRSVFVAAKKPLNNPSLVFELLNFQERG